jgi:hypothetical protein
MVNVVTFLGISILATLSLLAGRHLKRYPAFQWYVYSSLVQWMLAPVFKIIGNHAPGHYVYFWFYCAHEVITDVLILFVIREMYRKTYGPDRALPSWVPGGVRMRVLMMAVASFCLTALFSVTNGLGNYAVLVRVEGFAATFLFLMLWMLAIFALHLGLSFPDRVAQIATGFVLYMTINLFSVSFRGQFGPMAPMPAQMAGPLAYLVSLGLWCWTARKQEETITISQEQWNILMQEFSKV